MRVVAVRLAPKSLRSQRHEQPLDEDALERVVGAPLASDSPEHQHLKRLYGQPVKAAQGASAGAEEGARATG